MLRENKGWRKRETERKWTDKEQRLRIKGTLNSDKVTRNRNVLVGGKWDPQKRTRQ